MAYRNNRKAEAAFKKAKPKRSLKPWEEAALETARKTERLRALRLAKEAADRQARAETKGEKPAGTTPPDKSSSGA